MNRHVEKFTKDYLLPIALALGVMTTIGGCRQTGKSTTKADVAAYKFASIGASINLINGEVGENCLDLSFDQIKIDRALTPWQLNITKVSSHKDLLELMETSKGHLLAGSSASRYFDSASQRAKGVGSAVLHPTHEWLLISLTGGPKSSYVAPSGQLQEVFRNQDNWRSFRATCGDGYVSAAQQVHYVHVLIGVNVEDAIDRNSVKESLLQIHDSGDYSNEAVAKIKTQLADIGRTYPVTARVIDSSQDLSSAVLALYEIENLLATTTKTAEYGNGKLGEISIHPYEGAPAPPEGHQKMALDVLSELQARYVNLLDARSLVSYIVNGAERYHQDESFSKAVAANSEIFANLDNIADLHARCSALDTSCRTPDFVGKDLKALSSIRPVRRELKRSKECGVELYKIGTGEVCRDKTPTVYKLVASNACTVRQYKLAKSEACGIKSFKLAQNPRCGLDANPSKGFKLCRVADNGAEEFQECRHNSHGVDSYYECRDSSHGVELLPCRDQSFGDEVYKQCLL